MNILLAGATGAMGKVVSSLVAEEGKSQIVAGYAEENFEGSYPIYSNISDIDPSIIDVIVDFSIAPVLDDILAYAVEKKLPLVIAATGHTDKQINDINSASKEIPILYSGNMSIGVNIMTEVVKELSRKLSDFDIEIIEKHHHFKKDAPSGTAKMLYNAVNEGRDLTLELKYDRHNEHGMRSAEEVGMHTVRGGSIVGEHTVIFAGVDEVLEVKHSAGSKRIFAAGTLKAAKFIIHSKPGLYDMKDIF